MIHYGDTAELQAIVTGATLSNEFFGLQDFLEESGVTLPEKTYLNSVLPAQILPGLEIYCFPCLTPYEYKFAVGKLDYVFCDLHLELTERYFTAHLAIVISINLLNNNPEYLTAASALITDLRISDYTRKGFDSSRPVHIPWGYLSALEKLKFSNCNLRAENLSRVHDIETLHELNFLYSVVGEQALCKDTNKACEDIAVILNPGFDLIRQTYFDFTFARKSS